MKHKAIIIWSLVLFGSIIPSFVFAQSNDCWAGVVNGVWTSMCCSDGICSPGEATNLSCGNIDCRTLTASCTADNSPVQCLASSGCSISWSAHYDGGSSGDHTYSWTINGVSGGTDASVTTTAPAPSNQSSISAQVTVTDSSNTYATSPYCSATLLPPTCDPDCSAYPDRPICYNATCVQCINNTQCTSPQTCGGGGVPNQCGLPAGYCDGVTYLCSNGQTCVSHSCVSCTPASCSSGCGTIQDSCGQTLHCPVICTGNNPCDNTSHQCSCHPTVTSCTNKCGIIPDNGCGQPRDCTSNQCQSWQSCTSNSCVDKCSPGAACTVNGKNGSYDDSCNCTPGGASPTGGYPNPLGSVDNLYDFIVLVLKTLVGIMMPIIVVMFIISGLLFILARGNPAKLEVAKKALLYTTIGAAVVLGAWVLAQAIQTTINQIAGG